MESSAVPRHQRHRIQKARPIWPGFLFDAFCHWPKAEGSGLGRGHDELDQEVGGGQLGFAAGACRRVAFGHPCIPDFVHFGKVLQNEKGMRFYSSDIMLNGDGLDSHFYLGVDPPEDVQADHVVIRKVEESISIPVRNGVTKVLLTREDGKILQPSHELEVQYWKDRARSNFYAFSRSEERVLELEEEIWRLTNPRPQ